MVRILLVGGQPVADAGFMSGWMIEGGNAHVGRIAGLAGMEDGSMHITEDTNGVIYRLTYTGGRSSPPRRAYRQPE